MSEIKQVSGTCIPLILDDIDTDRIIPARFLRCVTFDGLGEHAFEDDREQNPNHPFENPKYQNSSVLLAGRNFGCGSSREHAPQSLMRWGIKAIIAESFAEIFFGNCTALGVPAVTASSTDVDELGRRVEADPQLEVKVDLVAKKVTAGDFSCDIDILDSARDALLSGQWDFMTLLLENQEFIKQTAEKIPYLNQFA
ncbi:3-isopropylmalate dehydratase small subunit [Rubinisphaera sp.]|uniref:3-isopropylmalate dehydratase small subunit n=1 Tax=Rubinisphaera sp. TaxID=2024857 RepID=UPI000C0E4F14|nr:3-isopropylmalate dehydratase small subunit [Rubinisphaera sp.]MBV10469.1 3-isopropylmalate dehydratase small subunit [Rubinisphaera sp.]|tara:strand:+ start:132 stop:722 length:591 start_codon:yes stop_codon:yes gene_type:complete